jgi:hypothetical protein
LTKLYIVQRDGVGLQVGIRRPVSRPSIWRRFARAIDKLITRVQEWLERPDTEAAKLVANLIIGGTLVMLAAQLTGAGR